MKGGELSIVAALALALACGGSAEKHTSTEPSPQAGSSGNGTGGQGIGGQGGAAAGTSGAAGSTCDDTVLRPEDDPYQTCPNLGPVCGPICEHATSRMKIAIAGRTIRCMASECMCLGPVSECEMRSAQCMIDQLATACPDPTTGDDCEELTSVCGVLTGFVCPQLLNGLTDAARAEVLACASADCSMGPERCVERVLMP